EFTDRSLKAVQTKPRDKDGWGSAYGGDYGYGGNGGGYCKCMSKCRGLAKVEAKVE
ncbi:hypothetical protein HHI36_007160, partial [Cryptolaemus montrouzieri]